MAAGDTGIMIAFLPTDAPWCDVELPHMTLVYAGTTEDRDRTISSYNSIAKDACALSMLTRPFTVEVTGQDIFGGPEDPVRVMTLRKTPELQAMRDFVFKWNKSEHIDFKPHITAGPATKHIEFPPKAVTFDRVIACFGEESLTFNLRSY